MYLIIRDTQAGLNLSFSRQLYDEQWSKNRVVTCLDWSPQVRRWFHEPDRVLCENGGNNYNNTLVVGPPLLFIDKRLKRKVHKYIVRD